MLKRGCNIFERTTCIISVAFSFFLISGVGGDLTSVPVNSLVVVGNTVRINCSTDSNQPVYWARTLAQSNEQQWLYYGGDGFDSNNADGRFRIDEDKSTGRYDLVIDGVGRKDAGQYVCVDESGIGETATAELVVSGMEHIKQEILKNKSELVIFKFS